MSFMPSVIRAEYRGDYRIHVTFNDNSENTIDFRRWLDGPVFEPLKDPGHFRRFFIDGGTVAWPNGADIAPETLYETATRERRHGDALKPRVGKRTKRRAPASQRQAK